MQHCPRCGEVLTDNAIFCSRCGLPLNNVVIVNNVHAEHKSPSVVKTTLSVLATLAVVIALFCGVYYLFFKVPVNDIAGIEDKHITFVKNGSPELYPDVTYDEAFTRFFSNRNWEYFVSDTGKDVVEFHGHCMYRDVEVEATIQFVLDMDEGTFDFEYLAFNDIPQIELVKYALISAIFEDY